MKWPDFPAPSVSMLLATLVLSAVPVFVLALAGLGWCCRSSRVDAAAKSIRDEHTKTVDEWVSNGTLRIDFQDPLLDAARFLLATERPLKDGGTLQRPASAE